ncbi:L,D-transpeptidase family protein [Aurantimonas aggregata]|uniref:L,D-transpeptidase family protein n=1 Tax=Aurantimonas aggregata TaxID=2047720 RepID=A0A6L9MDX6_9HYPH|nr:L,D-transpeptidase [Aurantimonas aggregata]NDV85861.1 L,D-transpeptidase family protein [Aurantimonas aggregata]
MRNLILATLIFSVLTVSSVALAATGEGPADISFTAEGDPGTIVIRTSERKLYLVTGNGRALAYDIAVGKPSEQWFGKSWVSKKRPNPTWTPTPSMRQKNPRLPQSVGPGPKNPLGERAINLGWGAYRIHGTNNPRSIGSAASAGCFRMRNEDVRDLYERVNVGAQVVVLR